MGLLRFLLALSVAVHHIPSHSFAMLNASVAVLTFFMISGFYMALVINEKYLSLPSGNIKFYVSRFLRIFPPYWTILALSVVWYIATKTTTVFSSNVHLGYAKQLLLALLNISIFGQDIYATIINALSIGAANPITEAATSAFGNDFFQDNYLVVGQSWSMGTELLFYLTVPFTLTKFTRVVTILAASLFVRAFIISHSIAFTPMVWGYRFFPSTFTFFCLGAIGYFVYLKIRNLAWSVHVGKAINVSILTWFIYLACDGGAFQTGDSYDSIRHWIFFLVMAASIPFLFLATRNNNYDRALGELSYPLYLVHGIVIGIVFSLGHLPYANFGSEITVLGFAVGVAIALYWSVDRPIDRYRKTIEMTTIKSLARKMAPAALITATLTAFGVAGLQFLTPSKLDPILVQVHGHYNLVKFDKKCFAIPQGISIDWEKDQVEKIPGVYVSDTADHVAALIPENATIEPPHLIKGVGNYNIVSYNGKYYGVPHGIPINWEDSRTHDIPGVLVNTNQDALEAAIPTGTSPPQMVSDDTPRQLRSIDRYNIVLFKGKFYAIPFSLPIDWAKDKVSEKPGVMLDNSLDGVVAMVKNAEMLADGVPHLRQTVGHFNIVQFHQIFYAVPQGIAVNWEKDKVADLPGVKSANRQDELIKLIGQ